MLLSISYLLPSHLASVAGAPKEQARELEIIVLRREL